jgi:hypothetical protein
MEPEGTWSFASQDLMGKNIYPSYGVEIDPVHPDVLYSATWGSGLYTSTDNGSSWSNANVPWDTIYSVLPHPTRGNPVFVGTTDVGLYYGTSGAWQKAAIPASPVTGIISDPQNSQELYASTASGGVSRSLDQGKSWSILNTYLGDTDVNGLAYHRGTKSIFALTQSRGVFRYDLTSDLGWIASSAGIPVLSGSTENVPGEVSSEGQAVPADEPELLRIDGSINPKVSRPLYEPIRTMAFDPINPLVGYIGTDGSGVFKCTDGGSSWTFLGLPSTSIVSLAVDLANPQVLYAGTNAGGVVKTSADGGITWSDQTLPGLPEIHTLVPSPMDASTLYAGTSLGLFKRGGDGLWTGPLLSGSITSIAPHPTRAAVLVIGTSSGAFITSDGGVTWQDAEHDLIGAQIRSVQFEMSADPHWIYYATERHGTLKAYLP